MKVGGFWSGHDCSFCILDDGKPVIHSELERYIREKEPKGDSVAFMRDVMGEAIFGEIDAFASCLPTKLLKDASSFELVSKTGVSFYGHHQAHAANAFFSSNLQKATIVTIDGGGVEGLNNVESATTAWTGDGNNITNVMTYPSYMMNVGGLWTRVTRYVFRLQNGWPRGHQAGTVMAMAALGDPERFKGDFLDMFRNHLLEASQKPAGQPLGEYKGDDPRHPYLGPWTDIADRSERDRFDLAAGFQSATEEVIKDLLRNAVDSTGIPDICIAGGVALNSVMIGKIQEWDIGVRSVYVPPVPYDGGLSIGAAQYHYHCYLQKPRVLWQDNFTPYLGESHKEEIVSYLKTRNDVDVSSATDDDVLRLLADGEIVSVFNSRSESGRRALGNRSILADPRRPDMKLKINDRVKHRQWFRPFAPSILRESVLDWFTDDVSSPYMTHVRKFREDVKEKVPAVVHFDGSARLQTVTALDNPWYHGFISKWAQMTGVPILLNTSFNDREPIVQTPEHAVNCYMSTEIDKLYFPEVGLVVTRRK